jgi:hypothetical protein
MQTKDPNDLDGPLHQVLQEWRVTESLPPRFQERVWQRIERRETHKSSPAWVLLRRILQDLRRPALATSYIAFLMLLGVGAGYWHSRIDNERASHELGTRYVQMMDPYQRR